MKTRKVLLALVVAVFLISISGSAYSEVRSFSGVSSESSGGQYILTIQVTEVVKSSGYKLLDKTKALDPASGCCCTICLPIIQK